MGREERDPKKKPVSAVDLFRATPKTNCKECGHPTCLAFATRVIVEKKPLDACPHLEDAVRAELAERIAEQQAAEIYVKRDLYKDTASFIRERLADHDFRAIAEGLGARYVEREGRPCLELRYLNRTCVLSREEVFLDGVPTGDHWDNILLYNYAYMAGSTPLAGEWIPIDSIPGHIPKKPELEHGCEEKISRHFEGRPQAFAAAAVRLGGRRDEGASQADHAFTFFPLPRIPFYLLYWDASPEEGFPARVKVLFDRSVTAYLDIESLVFLAEKFADALVAEDPATVEP